MDAAVASLLGAVAGGSATFLGTVVNNVSQSRRDERKERQAKKAEAYGNALRNLLLILHFRSDMTPTGSAVIGEDHVPKWFAAMVDAEYWVTILTAVCGSRYRDDLLSAAAELTDGIGRLLKMPRKLPPRMEEGNAIWHVYETVTTAAQSDLG